MIWWDAPRSNQTSALQIVNDFLSHNISVGYFEFYLNKQTNINKQTQTNKH